MPTAIPEMQREATQMSIRTSSACNTDGPRSVMGLPKAGMGSKEVVMFSSEAGGSWGINILPVMVCAMYCTESTKVQPCQDHCTHIKSMAMVQSAGYNKCTSISISPPAEGKITSNSTAMGTKNSTRITVLHNSRAKGPEKIQFVRNNCNNNNKTYH